ncbi:MAG: enoyl-CoA hydratase/isomerase family protein, partial [Planctomycetota bacterium]
MNHIRLDVGEGRAILTLDRPPLNVLNIEMMGEMADALGQAAEIPDLRVLVVRGEGKAFSAGVDVGEHMGDMARTMIVSFNELIAKFLSFPVPTVALVGGAALGGGCEVMLACDLVYATEKASFGQPEIKVGVYPPPAMVLLAPLVGERRAADLILTGRIVSAAEALAMGLVNGVHPAEEFEEATEKVIAGLAGLSRSVLRATIELMRSGADYLDRMEGI